MFYCNSCAKDNEWPETMVTSFGHCEVCGENRRCNERSSSLLPISVKVVNEPAREKDRIDRFLELFTEAERASWAGRTSKPPTWIVQAIAYFLGEEPATKELMKRLKESGD